jgi:hypothetical protein
VWSEQKHFPPPFFVNSDREVEEEEGKSVERFQVVQKKVYSTGHKSSNKFPQQVSSYRLLSQSS